MARRPSTPISVRNAQFQLWQAMLQNRTKRGRLGAFLIQGVRPATLAVEARWPLAAVLHRGDGPLSAWAEGILERADPRAERFALTPELLGELGEKDEAPELLLVGRIPADDPARLRVGEGFLGLVLDRPTNPGNVGTLIRSADAFGVGAIIVVGHAADPYDPLAVRASTGSLFGIPVVRMPSAETLLGWVGEQRAAGRELQLLGTDEGGTTRLDGPEIGHRPALLVVGNETSGMSRGLRDACDHLLAIPMAAGTASSLNAGVAGGIALYEAARRRPNADATERTGT